MSSPTTLKIVRPSKGGGASRGRLGVSAASRLRILAWDCRGALLLETIIAAMVFALIGVAVLAGLNTAFISGSKTEVQATAENLARNHMESLFSQPFREASPTDNSLGNLKLAL